MNELKADKKISEATFTDMFLFQGLLTTVKFYSGSMINVTYKPTSAREGADSDLLSRSCTVPVSLGAAA